jgi:hypothetical protein
MSTRRKFIQDTALAGGLGLIGLPRLSACTAASGAPLLYVDRFANTNHPEIGYWFISPDELNGSVYLPYLDHIADTCPYTLLFLTAREGADFYDTKLMHPVFSGIVAEAHKRNLRVGLQMWCNHKNVAPENAVRMLADDELVLDGRGRASLTAKTRYLRYPENVLKSDLLSAWAFKKTGDGFYDPATLQDITASCKAVSPDKNTVHLTIDAGSKAAGITAYLITQEYYSKSCFWGEDEYHRFADTIDAYGDIPFDGFALDEYGNKFVARINHELKEGDLYRGRWYSLHMEKKFREEKGESLVTTLFSGRYAPAGKPEIRMKAINTYMDFMRGGALVIENRLYHKSRAVFGNGIFNGIHDTYHNHLTNDELWANGISWWKLPRHYGQTDEKTSTPIQMGVAMAHPANAMYNQYYNIVVSDVITKALHDLRYGIRTHYHALHDKRPNRSDLASPEAVAGINRVEACARLLNRFNPRLPAIDLLVVYGIEALSNWYPNEKDRGVYDINDKIGTEDKCLQIWQAGYLNAVMPSDLIAEGKLTLDSSGRPTINGHTFRAVLYLNPQYAKEAEISFLENYVDRGGKLMIEGEATHDFNGADASARFASIFKRATVRGYDVGRLPELGLQKNLLPDGCRTEDGAWVYTDIQSLNTDASASFSLRFNGAKYTGKYKGLIALSLDKKGRIEKLAAAGLTEISRNGTAVLRFDVPTDVYFDQKEGRTLTVVDPASHIRPLANTLY